MSVTVSTSFTDKFDQKNARLVRMKSSGSDTSATVERGIGYQIPIGGYVDCTLSGDTLTLTMVGATNAYTNVLLIGA